MSSDLTFQSPRRHGSSKGKGTENPIKFLPVLPDTRSKPQWQESKPNFLLSSTPTGPQQDDKNNIDLITELTASKYLCDFSANTSLTRDLSAF